MKSPRQRTTVHTQRRAIALAIALACTAATGRAAHAHPWHDWHAPQVVDRDDDRAEGRDREWRRDWDGDDHRDADRRGDRDNDRRWDRDDDRRSDDDWHRGRGPWHGTGAYRDERDIPHWFAVRQVRTQSDGRTEERLVLPRGAWAVRLAAVKRRANIQAAWVEYGNGRRERLPELEGRLDDRGDANARLRRPCGDNAVLHIVHETGQDGRKATFDVLFAR